MKLSLNWLKDYVALDAPVEEIGRAITFLGFEVEDIAHTGAPRLANVFVGEVLTRDKHPNADKLSVCTVDVGAAGGVKTIVCGAQNYKVGDRVPVAIPGAVLPGNFVITQSKIRGQLSDGMMCSAKEIGAAQDADGLLILNDRPALGTPINAVLPPGDVVFDVEITPNRPDCLSHLGIARELAAWFKRDLVYPAGKFNGDTGKSERTDLLGSVRVDSPEDCPLYTAHIVSGVKIAPSPAWMQERLRAVGLRPVNNVVDVGNYVMLETGQPLHAFDARRLAGARIVVRRADEGEKIVTLDGKERTLTNRTLVIADAEKPVVIAGIMGGENSGVAADTTDIVLESAVFRRGSVRWSSRHLSLTSDSAYRYERGVDPHAAMEAAWRAIDLIIETADGRVVGPVFKFGGDVPWKREIVVTHGFVCEKLGFDIPPGNMREAFDSLELTVDREEETEGRGTAWTVSVPSWRDDLDRPIDLVEEVLRLHGTDRVPAAPVSAPALAVADAPTVEFNRRATNYLVGHDFHECANLTLRPVAEIAVWAPASAAGLGLANPFVGDQSHLRPTLLAGLLESLKLNQARGVPVSRLCESGRIFVERGGMQLECASVAFIVAEPDGRRTWLKRAPLDFFSAKHHVESLAAIAGIDLSGYPAVPAAAPFCGWQEDQSAAAGGMDKGWLARFGLLDLALVRSLGVEGRVYAGAFAILPDMLPAGGSRRKFLDFSAYPAALRDLALEVDEAVPAGEVRDTLLRMGRVATGGAFALEGVDIFDVYRGEGLPPGKKSLAFAFVFRSPTRTLNDDEVNGALAKVQESLAKTTAYAVRK